MSKSLNTIINDIYTLMDDLEAKTKHIINQHPELKSYTFFLELIKPQNTLYKETINTCLKSSDVYHTKNLENILQIRYSMVHRIYQYLDKESIDNGINVMNSLYNDILTDFEFQKKRKDDLLMDFNSIEDLKDTLDLNYNYQINGYSSDTIIVGPHPSVRLKKNQLYYIKLEKDESESGYTITLFDASSILLKNDDLSSAGSVKVDSAYTSNFNELIEIIDSFFERMSRNPTFDDMLDETFNEYDTALRKMGDD